MTIKYKETATVTNDISNMLLLLPSLPRCCKTLQLPPKSLTVWLFPESPPSSTIWRVIELLSSPLLEPSLPTLYNHHYHQYFHIQHHHHCTPTLTLLELALCHFVRYFTIITASHHIEVNILWNPLFLSLSQCNQRQEPQFFGPIFNFLLFFPVKTTNGSNIAIDGFIDDVKWL